MAVLVYAEHTQGSFKKGTLQALTYGRELAAALGTEVHAAVLGSVNDGELAKLAAHGAAKVHHIAHARFGEGFDSGIYAQALHAAAQAASAEQVVMGQSANGRAVAPRLAVRMEAGLLSGVTHLASAEGAGLKVQRTAYTNKAVEFLTTASKKAVITVKANAYKASEQAAAGEVSALDFSPAEVPTVKVLETRVAEGEIPLPEAEIVVSAGRGIGGTEEDFKKNWQPIGELAELIGAATACSKPIGDLHWRPHHEHVGQTGVQIAPNVYIAFGISGAIQHLAGVSASKTMIVINTDEEAPFFKAADYGIVGDAQAILPKLVDAVKAYKAANG